jgi:hypothetical protein
MGVLGVIITPGMERERERMREDKGMEGRSND